MGDRRGATLALVQSVSAFVLGFVSKETFYTAVAGGPIEGLSLALGVTLLASALDTGWMSEHPVVRSELTTPPSGPAWDGLSEHEIEEMRKHLKGLGYFG